MNRRNALKALAALGIGTATFQKAAAAIVQDKMKITPEMIAEAEWISGLELTEDQRESLAASLQRAQANLERIREIEIDETVTPAFVHRPLGPAEPANLTLQRAVQPIESVAPQKPNNSTDLAFLPVSELSTLIRDRVVSSLELTKIYLERLKKYNPLLNCVVNLTEDLALSQAQKADQEIASGRYRGPLHGIPWGAKDLIAIPGYPTTWGAPQYKEQMLPYKATVAQRLEDAGAVLLGKLSLGALAMGDRWFNGMTRCPWNPKIGSSGSSAGSASAAVAGLCGFTIGSETLGSIISPSRRCGASSLRPTFGRVSRFGCMTLSWTMDKLGPICRSIEDCALIFAAIHGRDGLDPTTEDQPFHWPPKRDIRTLKVGYVKARTSLDERKDIAILKDLGVQLVEVELPKLPAFALTMVLGVEAAASFSDITRKNDLEGIGAWDRIFQEADFTSAVDFVRAMRARRILMEQMEEVMSKVDVLINANDLAITNLTGHPSTVIPSGFRKRIDIEMPSSTIFTGQLHGETDLLALTHAYQQKLTAHLAKPPLDDFLKQMEEEKKIAEEKEREKEKTESQKGKDNGQQNKKGAAAENGKESDKN